MHSSTQQLPTSKNTATNTAFRVHKSTEKESETVKKTWPGDEAGGLVSGADGRDNKIDAVVEINEEKMRQSSKNQNIALTQLIINLAYN